MKRDHNKTVTNQVGFRLPILIPARENDAAGEATFGMELWDPAYVRPVTLSEVKIAAKELKGAEGAHFGALLALRGAIESRDQLAMDRAADRIREVYKLKKAERPNTQKSVWVPEYLSQFTSGTGFSVQEITDYLDGFRPGPKASKDPKRLFSYEVSKTFNQLIRNAQLVLWWNQGAHFPAIFCPDLNTALYVHTFFISPMGGQGFRHCPYCGESFFQDRPNQDYCCPAHREAHRVARWRANRKPALNAGQKKGGKNGTQKAR